MGAYDMQQPREVTKGYFIRAEQMNDFIDYLFDIEQVGNYKELWDKFEKWQDEQYGEQLKQADEEIWDKIFELEKKHKM